MKDEYDISAYINSLGYRSQERQEWLSLHRQLWEINKQHAGSDYIGGIGGVEESNRINSINDKIQELDRRWGSTLSKVCDKLKSMEPPPVANMEGQ